MDRFLSNTINKVDKKGRVSIPASFRPVLGDTSRLYTLNDVEHPTVDAGGIELIERKERQLEGMSALSSDYDAFSFVLHGDSGELKIDREGRVIISDIIREHTGITDQVAFVGRGHFFQLWKPEAFLAYREEARKKVAEMRRAMSNGVGVATGRGE